MKILIEKYLPYLIVVLLLVACNPFVSKQTRKDNRCNKKFEKLLNECPQLKDTVFVDVPFEVIVPKIEIKDSLTVRIDTVELLKYITKEQIRYIIKTISIDTSYVDSLYRLQISLYNGVLSFDVEIAERTIKDVVKAPVQVVKPVKISLFNQFLLKFGKYWTIFVLIILAIISYFFAKKFFR